MAFGDILRLFTESDDQDLLGRLKPFMPRTLESERLNSILDFYIEAQVRLDKNDFRKLVNLYSLFHRKQSPVEVRSNHLLLNWAVVKLRSYPRLVRHLNLFLPDAHRIPDVRVHIGSSGGRSRQLYADQAAKELMEEENAFFARKLKERPDASSHDDEDLGRKDCTDRKQSPSRGASILSGVRVGQSIRQHVGGRMHPLDPVASPLLCQGPQGRGTNSHPRTMPQPGARRPANKIGLANGATGSS